MIVKGVIFCFGNQIKTRYPQVPLCRTKLLLEHGKGSHYFLKRDSNLYLAIVSTAREENFQKVAQCFQVALHFSPCHPKPKKLVYSFELSLKIILKKTEPLFLGLLCFQYLFSAFMV